MQSRDKGAPPTVTVEEFVLKSPPEMGLEVIAGGENLSARRINSARIQKLGLALAGFAHYIHEGRVQIVGQSEVWYLEQIEPSRRSRALEHLDLDKISCIVVTKGLTPPDELRQIASDRGVPLLRSSLVSSAAIEKVTDTLLELLAPSITLHGVLLGR